MTLLLCCRLFLKPEAKTKNKGVVIKDINSVFAVIKQAFLPRGKMSSAHGHDNEDCYI